MAKIYFFFLFVLGEDDLLPQTASFSYQPESLFSSLLFKEMDGFFYQIMQVPSCWNLWNARTAVSTQGNSSEIRWFPVLGTHPCLCAVQTFTVYEFIPTQPFCPHDWWPSALSTLQWERQVKSGVMEWYLGTALFTYFLDTSVLKFHSLLAAMPQGAACLWKHQLVHLRERDPSERSEL